MPSSNALELLLKAYRYEIDWLLTKAKQCERGQPDLAVDFIHHARNLQAVLQTYERLSDKSPERSQIGAAEPSEGDQAPLQANE